MIYRVNLKNLVNYFVRVGGLVFILAFLHTGVVFAATADLSLVPSSKTVQNGQTFSAEIRVDTNGESINTVTADISYQPDKLRAISINTSGSFVTIWFENNVATASGQIRLTGSVASPGVTGSSLLFATINFSTLAEGTTAVSFDASSAVYRNTDNTDILNGKSGGSYTIAAAVSSTPIPTPTPTDEIAPTTAPTPTAAPVQLPYVGVSWPTQFLFVLSLLLITGGGMIIAKGFVF